MGSPLGPTLANIFTSALETRYLDECPPVFKSVLYRRYVDDTFFCLFKDPEHINSFLQHINSFHPNIKFTVEVENDTSLPFLDVSILKNRDGFSTSLYRKSTFTGLYADFGSLIPNKYKINLINVLIYRAFHICSTYANFQKELCSIKTFLLDNCFPKSLIDRVIRTFLNNQFSKNNKTSSQTDDKQRILFFLPYLGQYSFRIKHNINKLIKQCYPNVKLQFIFRSTKRFSNMFVAKERLPSLLC